MTTKELIFFMFLTLLLTMPVLATAYLNSAKAKDQYFHDRGIIELSGIPF